MGMTAGLSFILAKCRRPGRQLTGGVVRAMHMHAMPPLRGAECAVRGCHRWRNEYGVPLTVHVAGGMLLYVRRAIGATFQTVGNFCEEIFNCEKIVHCYEI